MLAPKLKSVLVTIFAVGALVASASAQAAPTQAGASSAVEAVTTLITPFYQPSAGGGSCDPVRGALVGCPITARFLDRLYHPTAQENGNLISRSQNPPIGVEIAEADNNGTLAHVDTHWRYGMGVYGITFVVMNQGGAWSVDDSYCIGQPETTIYTSPTGPCNFEVITTGGGVPGMPRTGHSAGDASLSVLSSLAALALVAGLGALLIARRRVSSATEK